MSSRSPTGAPTMLPSAEPSCSSAHPSSTLSMTPSMPSTEYPSAGPSTEPSTTPTTTSPSLTSSSGKPPNQPKPGAPTTPTPTSSPSWRPSPSPSSDSPSNEPTLETTVLSGTSNSRCAANICRYILNGQKNAVVPGGYAICVYREDKKQYQTECQSPEDLVGVDVGMLLARNRRFESCGCCPNGASEKKYYIIRKPICPSMENVCGEKKKTAPSRQNTATTTRRRRKISRDVRTPSPDRGGLPL